MATTKKYFVSKMNLPFNIKKGENFIEEPVGSKFMCYRFEIGKEFTEDDLVPFVPSKEPNFFEEVSKPIEPKFKSGDIVRLKNNTRVECKLKSLRKTNEMITSKVKFEIIGIEKRSVSAARKTKVVIFYEVKPDYNNVTYIIEEDKLINYEFYYFVNSKGKICQEMVGREITTDVFRKSIGNYFKTVEEGREYINKLKELA